MCILHSNALQNLQRLGEGRFQEHSYLASQIVPDLILSAKFPAHFVDPKWPTIKTDPYSCHNQFSASLKLAGK